MIRIIKIIIGSAFILTVGPIVGLFVFLTVIQNIGLQYINRKIDFSKAHRLYTHLSKTIGNQILLDKRNYPYIIPIIWASTWVPFLYFIGLYRYYHYGFEWITFMIIHALRLGPKYRFFAYSHVLVHKDGHDHKGLFKGQWKILDRIVQWVIGPLYGVVPNNYTIAHNKLHHRFTNQIDDPHTNIDLDRSNPLSFVEYFPRFLLYWSGIGPVIYCIQKSNWKHVYIMLKGMVYYYGLMFLAISYDWKVAFMYCVYPHLESTMFIGGISYMWHCFVDSDDPTNDYINSLTIIDGHDNIWGEDYHVVHHISSVHWSEYENKYKQDIDNYKKYQATIFRDTEEGLILFWILTCQINKLADHFVDLNGKLTHEEKKELIMKRLSTTVEKKKN